MRISDSLLLAVARGRVMEDGGDGGQGRGTVSEVGFVGRADGHRFRGLDTATFRRLQSSEGEVPGDERIMV